MNEVANLPSTKAITTNYKSRNKERRWELSYGYKDKFYLTTEEKEFFLEQVMGGKDVVVIEGNVFTRFFKSLTFTVAEGDNYIKL
jgi:hypothetical protein